MSAPRRNEVTIKLTFSDADFDELEGIARDLRLTPDAVLARILSPESLARHVRDAMLGCGAFRASLRLSKELDRIDAKKGGT